MEEDKYKAALERAKSAIKECGNNLGRIKMIESIFPDELGENKDEKIRKKLIEYFKDLMGGWFPYSNEEIIAYLEKMKDFDKKLEEAYKTADEVQYKRGYDKGYMDGYWYWRGAIEALGKQATIKDGNSIDPHFGKPITTTEMKTPQFKVGDWISGYYTNYKVLSVNNEGYAVEDVDGNKINILFENEKFHHLWSIKDAKKGDVLARNDDIRSICIFSCFDGINKREESFLCRCGLEGEGLGQVLSINGYHDDSKDYVPATKEQCELLFRELEEAGYTWNPITKELSHKEVSKKSEQDDKWKWDEDDEKFFRENILIGLGNIDDVNPELYSKIIDWISLIKRRLS